MVTVAAPFASVRVPVFLGSKWAFQGLEKIVRDEKSWVVVQDGIGVRVWKLPRDHHALLVMDPREVPL